MKFSFRQLKLALCVLAASPVAAFGEIVLTAGKAEVVISPAAPKTVRFAAEEMTNFLSRVFGGEVAVVTAPTVGRKGIYLGDGEWTRKAGIDVSKLARDAFVITADDRGVYIAGRDDPREDTRLAVYAPWTGYWSQYHEHATLFGVYEFLERFAGVRMYFPGELGTIVPRAGEVRVPQKRFEVAPDFLQRNYSAFSDGVYFEGEKRDMKLLAGRKLNYQRNRMQTMYIPCCHGSNGFNIQRRFASSHPEYMMLFEKNGKLVRDVNPAEKAHHPGQLCHSSAVYGEFYNDILSYLKGEAPTVRGVAEKKWPVMTFRKPWVDVMPQDGFQPCRCEKCENAYRKGDEHYATELVWGRTVELADRLSKAGADVRITQMAYPPYRRIPDFPIPQNVDVMVAEAGPWSLSNPAGLKDEYDEIRRWSEKLGRKVWIWTYPNKFGAMNLPDIPNGTPRAWAKYFKDVSPWVFGAFAECENDRFFYNHLSYYVFGKVCWDVDTDVEALLDEYFRLMFGAGAEPMARFSKEVEDKWVNEVAGTLVNTAEGPKRQPPSPYALYMKIYSLDTLSRWNKLLAAARAAVPEGSLEARRVDLYRREILQPLAVAAKRYRMSVAVAPEVKRRDADPALRNLLVNADFSAPPAGISKRHFGLYKDPVHGYGWLGGWICGDKDLPHISFTDDAPKGVAGKVLRMENRNGADIVQISNHFIPKNGKFKNGVRYRVSFFTRLTDVVPHGRGGGVGIRIWSDRNEWFPKNRLTGTTGWIHQEFFFTAGAKSSGHESQFSVYLWKATGVVEYAGFLVEEVPDTEKGI